MFFCEPTYFCMCSLCKLSSLFDSARSRCFNYCAASFITIVTSDLPATKLQWRALNDEACVKLQVEFCLRATIISRRWISLMPKRAPSAMIINPSTHREVEEEEEKKDCWHKSGRIDSNETCSGVIQAEVAGLDGAAGAANKRPQEEGKVRLLDRRWFKSLSTCRVYINTDLTHEEHFWPRWLLSCHRAKLHAKPLGQLFILLNYF